jgi:WD40 repeat protein
VAQGDPARPILLSGGDDGIVARWDLRAGRTRGTYFAEAYRRIDAVAGFVAPDGRNIVVAVQDNRLFTWDNASHGSARGSPIHAPLTGPATSFTSLAATTLPDQRAIAITGGRNMGDGHGGTVRTWDPLRPEPYDDTRPSLIDALAVKNSIVVAGADGKLGAWRLDTGEPFIPSFEYRPELTSVLVNDELVGVAGGFDGSIQRWNLRTGEQLGELETRHEGAVTGLAEVPGPNGNRMLVSASWRGVILWVTDGPVGLIRDYPDRFVAMTTLVWDGQPLIVLGEEQGAILLIDLTGEYLWKSHANSPIAAMASGMLDDQPILLVGTHDGSVTCWDMTSRAELRTMRPHNAPIISVATAMLPDDRLVVASVGQDETVVLSDVCSGRQLGAPLATMARPRALAVSNEGATPVLVIGGIGNQHADQHPRLGANFARVTWRDKPLRGGAPSIGP